MITHQPNSLIKKEINSELGLNKGEAHIFFTKLDCSDTAIKKAYKLLSIKERDRADRFVVDKPRRCYIASAAKVRQLLSPYLAIQPDSICYDYGEHGKPYLIDSDLQFNISHAGDRLAVAIVLEQSVGIDIEYHSSKLNPMELAQRFFNPNEYQQLLAVSRDQQLLYFYRLWTLKEAFVKATGKGLSFGLANFVVDIHAEAMDSLQSVNAGFGIASDWSLGLLSSSWSDYTAALAVRASTKLILHCLDCGTKSLENH